MNRGNVCSRQSCFLQLDVTVFIPAGGAGGATHRYCLFKSKWDHDVQNEPHAALKKSLN